MIPLLNSLSCVYLCTFYKFTFLKDVLLHLGEFQLTPLKHFKSAPCSSSFKIISQNIKNAYDRFFTLEGCHYFHH